MAVRVAEGRAKLFQNDPVIPSPFSLICAHGVVCRAPKWRVRWARSADLPQHSALNRPFDDLSVAKIRTDAEAVLLLIAEVEGGRAELVSSEYLLFEVAQTPDLDRAHRVTTLLGLGTTVVRGDTCGRLG